MQHVSLKVTKVHHFLRLMVLAKSRATSAAATFFDPITIGLQEYVDGANGYNNPVELVLEEVRRIWKDAAPRVQCLVSIGTGIPNPKDFGDNLKEVFGTLKAISIEIEKNGATLLKNSTSFGIGGRYFRFNISKGLNGIGLDECDQKSLGQITAASEAYLEDERVRECEVEFGEKDSQIEVSQSFVVNLDVWVDTQRKLDPMWSTRNFQPIPKYLWDFCQWKWRVAAEYGRRHPEAELHRAYCVRRRAVPLIGSARKEEYIYLYIISIYLFYLPWCLNIEPDSQIYCHIDYFTDY
ncbi:uncharacterized protein TRIVIDRAFT_67213 [Trichoderma virens Gv29-8]|uniref:PNPLA domain-containing protein n=1 Tax=Hypocrea virens (strain Gv29-8 / FGSC 10586) TaxID=413071 RepID=G9N5F3_HYPVG|nr:uncharacterized protein TRIVIDRAFT_67213 [Trichoderma virens Gv29-8]EHK17998.1 hypothetical protein TRIVIDRAFT_67213 [Trichoderma virens Gv29-8]